MRDRARPADIAVLCHTRAQGAKVADALRKRGLPARIQSEGWLEAPATAVARAVIALVADPCDRLAALGIVTRGPARMPLAQALRATIDTTLDAHADLERLAKLSSQVRDLPVGDLVPGIIAAAGLRDWAKGLAAPELALADVINQRQQQIDPAGTDHDDPNKAAKRSQKENDDAEKAQARRRKTLQAGTVTKRARGSQAVGPNNG